MLRKRLFPLVLPCVALAAAFAAPEVAFADVAASNSNPANLPTPSTSDDILLGKTPDQVFRSGYGGGQTTSANSAPGSESSSTNWGTLTDGIFGTSVPYSTSTVVTPNSSDELTYYFANVNNDPFGVNINTVDMLSVWGDNGRSDQNFTILYSTTANSGNYNTLATVSYAGSQSGNGNPYYEFTSTAAAVNNVARIQVVFGSQENGYAGYQELLAHGAVATSGTALAPQTSGLIQAGSFESPVFTGANYVVPAGWIASGNASVGVNDNTGPFAPTGTPAVPDGNQFAFIQLSGNSTSTGTFGTKLDNLVIGDTYQLSYYISERNGNAGATLQPEIDSTLIGLPNIAVPGAWTEETYDFTYTGTDASPYLNFVGTDIPGNDQTIDLDDVQLAVLPEPASVALFGVSGLALLRRRRTSAEA